MNTFKQICFSVLLFSSSLVASAQNANKEPEGERIIAPGAGTVKGGEPGWEKPKEVSFTEKEAKKECAKYNGKYIGFYSRVFKVENCRRRLVTEDYLESLGRRAPNIIAVENDTLIKIPAGEPVEVQAKRKSCKALSGRYFISAADEMFVMENCKLRAFADYETFEDHAKKRKRSKSNVVELSSEDLAYYERGEPIPTILDEVFALEPVVENEVDVIPLSEACRGLNGNYVSYFSKVYKIENCRKRELESPENFRRRLSRGKIKELSSEQWISLPNGTPL